MSQSLVKNWLHLVFSTKNREPYLRKEVRPKLYAYMNGILQKWDSPGLLIGGMADHVHLLFLLSKNHTLIKIVEQVKTGSSKWIKTEVKSYANFHWQTGYGAFSVSQSNLKIVQSYIENQEQHHKGTTFQDEIRAMLQKHQIEYDERYVWD